MGLLIFVIKIDAWMIRYSVALLSDALESIVNILTSALMLISVWMSDRPLDSEHLYEHQKIERLSSEGSLSVQDFTDP